MKNQQVYIIISTRCEFLGVPMKVKKKVTIEGKEHEVEIDVEELDGFDATKKELDDLKKRIKRMRKRERKKTKARKKKKTKTKTKTRMMQRLESLRKSLKRQENKTSSKTLILTLKNGLRTMKLMLMTNP